MMWGFCLLHVKRMVGGAPAVRRWQAALVLTLLFAGVIADPRWLLAVTSGLLMVGLILFHEPLDIADTAYLIVLGASIEYTGVYGGLWSYPNRTLGNPPVWFITLWGGVGLFFCRLVLPLLTKWQAAPVSYPDTRTSRESGS